MSRNMGTWDRGSQWCNRLHKGPMGPVAGFVFWERESEEGKGGDETRIATEESQQRNLKARAGRLFCYRQPRKKPSPRIQTFYSNLSS